MKPNIYRGTPGISIKLATEKIKRELSKKTPTKKRNKKNSYQAGNLQTSDLQNISIGLDILRRVINQGLGIKETHLLEGKSDVSKSQFAFVNFSNVMEDFLFRIHQGIDDEFHLQSYIDSLTDYSKVLQAARDGIILKQEKRKETQDGETREVLYDTSMSPREALHILKEYQMQAEQLRASRLNNYFGLGMGFAGAIGTLLKESKNAKNNSNGKAVPILTLGAIAAGGLKLLQGTLQQKDRKEQRELHDQEYKITNDLLENEQISTQAQEVSIQDIKTLVHQSQQIDDDINNQQFASAVILDTVIAIISGLYIKNSVKSNANNKIDGRSLASALVSLQSTKEFTRTFIGGAEGILNSRKQEEEFRELCEKVLEIQRQMEEKVYPLEGATHSFDSFEISNFVGNFYPKKDYETGKTHFSTTITIPEFSMKRGDTVLLSGESGTGKSTFLRFLKRGDINNRKAIKLDDGGMVDNLGNEYISFRPSINLGDENNVLYQITGKENISDLTEEETENVLEILKELKFDSPQLLKDLASKKFMEFSTGQQRRLALSKVFYRIDDGTSVIIVDEPVGNVEDSLIREQLEMIKRYAESRNLMLILTTHRIDLAEDLATKRYNINEDGILEELPVVTQEKDLDDER